MSHTPCYRIGPVVMLLLASGCIHYQLPEAAKYGRSDRVRELLQHGADPNQAGKSGETPLHFAAAGNATEVVSLLLEAGAEPNARTEFGTTPLHRAAASGASAIVGQLLDAGADPNASNSKEFTPLHLALKHHRLDVATRLLASGADPNLGTDTAGAPLHWTAMYGGHEVTTALIADGADPNARRIDGATPLYIAADLGRLEVVKALLAGGAEPNAANYSGLTALHRAVLRDRPDVTDLLLGAGATVRAPTDEAPTPLNDEDRERLRDDARRGWGFLPGSIRPSIPSVEDIRARSQIPLGSPVIFVYRIEDGSQSQFQISANGKRFTRVLSGGYFPYIASDDHVELQNNLDITSPGVGLLEGLAASAEKNTLSVLVGEGQTLFVRCRPVESSLMNPYVRPDGRLLMEIVPSEIGLGEIQRLKPLEALGPLKSPTKRRPRR